LSETTGKISLEFGSSFSQSMTIKSNADLTIGQIEWIVHGCYPGEARIAITLASSGEVKYSEEFQLIRPLANKDNFC